ncbi:PLP-dependent aminotransferase family protein [Neisseriaceae bacterium JH1-16]|nr:PLP-dependent aminotransferase family protein [Neisseriaceae bacterium JH1-16]
MIGVNKYADEQNESTDMNLYEKLADEIEELVRGGVLLPGERVPSVRQMSQHRRISITTVIRAYVLLESRGVLESRPQSGYFVRQKPSPENKARMAPPPPLQKTHPLPISTQVDMSRLVLSTLRSINSHEAVPLGSPYPDASPFPLQRISKYANIIVRRHNHWSVLDDLPPGNPHLIRQIARRYMENGQSADPSEIIITVGATEALNLCLQAVAKPGDTIAVESPTYYAFLHAIERLGMRALEVPTHPREGIDIEALAAIMDSQPIAACMVMPNFQNPLGFQMPENRKIELVRVLSERQIPVIENAIYNELYYGESHPTSLKSYDSTGLVLHCSSFSKTLSSAYRVGWAMPGKYRDLVEKYKFLNTLTTSSIPQLAIAEYLIQDGYDHHLRRIRKSYAQQASIMTAMVQRFFPAGTITSQPMGGYVLWVELPEWIDSMKLYHLALERKITIGPGYMFSTTDAYRSCIRLNYSYPWTAAIEAALITVGQLAASCELS